MFSDRLWLAKAAVALGLLSLLCNAVNQDLSDRHPPVERIALSADYRGRLYHLTARQVDASDPHGFQITTQVGPMRLLTSTPPPAGAFVTVNARPIGPRTLEVVQMAVHDGYAWKRTLNYGVSVLTLIGYLWLVSRRFRWRIEEGVFRSKY